MPPARSTRFGRACVQRAGGLRGFEQVPQLRQREDLDLVGEVLGFLAELLAFGIELGGLGRVPNGLDVSNGRRFRKGLPSGRELDEAGSRRMRAVATFATLSANAGRHDTRLLAQRDT
jgi:hypothetical protein